MPRPPPLILIRPEFETRAIGTTIIGQPSKRVPFAVERRQVQASHASGEFADAASAVLAAHATRRDVFDFCDDCTRFLGTLQKIRTLGQSDATLLQGVFDQIWVGFLDVRKPKSDARFFAWRQRYGRGLFVRRQHADDLGLVLSDRRQPAIHRFGLTGHF